MSNRSRPASRSLGLIPNLERATHAIGVYVQKADARCTQAEANVLAFLYDRGPSSLSDVHASFGHRRSTLTSVVDRLEARKLVTRERHPEDGRAFVLALTTGGKATARAVTSHLGELEARIATRVTQNDLRAFVKVANALVDAAEEDSSRR